MEIICSPLGIVDIDRPAQGVMDIRQAGFYKLVLDTSLCANSTILERVGKSNYKRNHDTVVIENPEKLYERLERMLENVKKQELDVPVAIAPCLDVNTRHTDLNDKIRALTIETIKACGKAGCTCMIVEPLFAGITGDDIWAANKEYYLSFLDVARQNNVRILLKNQCRSIGGHLIRGICSDGQEAAQWVDALNQEAGEERFGFCMDVGVCNLCGQNMYDFICILGSRLKAVIARDCDGNQDNALLPFTAANQGGSRTDWLNFFRGLRSISFDGMMILNLEDTAAAASPLLRPTLLGYAKAVADYFRWQIEIELLLRKYPSRVLFGAGNMCRNYMKCYGKIYPPLFTCDNNSRLWDTEFCGLTVRNPEAIKALPKDTAIFICNIYYREIERQLRDMGVENPIEYFNDEYMPTFHFDRLEGNGRK